MAKSFSFILNHPYYINNLHSVDLMSFNFIMSFNIYILPFIKNLIRLSSIRVSNRPRTLVTISNI